MLECVDKEKRDHVKNKLRLKLKHNEKSYAKSQELLGFLQIDKDFWETKLGKMETKSKEFATLEETLKSSLEAFLLSKKELEGEVSELKDDLVANYDTYFGHAEEQVSFF